MFVKNFERYCAFPTGIAVSLPHDPLINSVSLVYQRWCVWLLPAYYQLCQICNQLWVHVLAIEAAVAFGFIAREFVYLSTRMVEEKWTWSHTKKKARAISYILSSYSSRYGDWYAEPCHQHTSHKATEIPYRAHVPTSPDGNGWTSVNAASKSWCSKFHIVQRYIQQWPTSTVRHYNKMIILCTMNVFTACAASFPASSPNV